MAALLAYLSNKSVVDKLALGTYLGCYQILQASLRAGFSATLIPALLSLVTVIIFSHWPVGRHSGWHQMSPSQQPPSEGSLSGWMPFFWETQSHYLHPGLALTKASPHFHSLCKACLWS